MPVAPISSKECANHDTGPGDRARLHRLDQHGGRGGLHRLHRHRYAVESARQRVKETEGGQNPGRCHADDRDRADNVRQEGSKVAERAGNLADTPAEAGAGEHRRFIRRLIGAHRDGRNPEPPRPGRSDRPHTGWNSLTV
jgi:hypothetical protein